MERPGNARAFQRLFFPEFRTERHKPRHFRLSNLDFLAAIIRKRNILDLVVHGFCPLLFR